MLESDLYLRLTNAEVHEKGQWYTAGGDNGYDLCSS